MKKLLSILLAMSIALTAIPAKADPFDAKNIANSALLTAGIAGATLLTAGIVSAFLSYDLATKEKSGTLLTIGTASALLSYKLYKDYEKEKNKLTVINNPFPERNPHERACNNFTRLVDCQVAGIVALSTLSGLALTAYKYFFGK